MRDEVVLSEAPPPLNPESPFLSGIEWQTKWPWPALVSPAETGLPSFSLASCLGLAVAAASEHSVLVAAGGLAAAGGIAVDTAVPEHYVPAAELVGSSGRIVVDTAAVFAAVAATAAGTAAAVTAVAAPVVAETAVAP